MRRARSRLICSALLALAPLWGAGCNPSGARFSPASGVLTVTGTDAADSFVVSATAEGAIVVNGGAVPIQGGVPTLENTVQIRVEGGGGDDQLVVSQFGAAMPDASLSGGPGNDVLIGGAGDDDFVGGPGGDQILMGAGDDTFLWLPGDGLDTVDGQAGTDELVFQASDDAENLDVYASNNRAQVFRNLDSVLTDLVGVETLELRTWGGSDRVQVGGLATTEVTKVVLDLRGSGEGPDGEVDTVLVNATNGADDFGVEDESGPIRVIGLSAEVEIRGAEPADSLTLNAMAGPDVVDATALSAGRVALVLDAGLGDDVLIGGESDELANGGDGDDDVFLGGGDDRLVWNPGDDLDLFEGGEGSDTLQFSGGNVAETFEISAVSGRVRLFRNVAAVTMDLDGVETIDLATLGGADLVMVRDLSGSDVGQVNLALGTLAGAGDAQPDAITVVGTDGDDAMTVYDDAERVFVTGLPALVSIDAAEVERDSLHIFTVAGNDGVDGSGLSAFAIQMNADGGDDDDVLIGSDGVDVLQGGEGDDVLLGGPGVDVLDGGPGDNVVVQ